VAAEWPTEREDRFTKDDSVLEDLPGLKPIRVEWTVNARGDERVREDTDRKTGGATPADRLRSIS